MIAACWASLAVLAGSMTTLYALDWYKNRKRQIKKSTKKLVVEIILRKINCLDDTVVITIKTYRAANLVTDNPSIINSNISQNPPLLMLSLDRYPLQDINNYHYELIISFTLFTNSLFSIGFRINGFSLKISAYAP